MRRSLVVNADDFGRSPGINRGVARAHERGIVTSASLMVRWPAAPEAAAYARARPALSIGLHLDLGEWIFRDGGWHSVYEVVPAGDAAAVGEELACQLGRFRSLVGAGPTHLDSHQHLHREEPVRASLLELAEELDVPLRGACDGVRHCGDFHGQTETGEPVPGALTVERLADLLHGLPEGATELGCHPAAEADLDSVYGAERLEELQTLCDPRLPEILAAEGIELRSFA